MQYLVGKGLFCSLKSLDQFWGPPSLIFSDLCLFCLEICITNPTLEIVAPAKQSFPNNWQISKALPGSRFAYMAFILLHVYDCIAKLRRQQADVARNHKIYNQFLSSSLVILQFDAMYFWTAENGSQIKP
jgi:hypothetical protein